MIVDYVARDATAGVQVRVTEFDPARLLAAEECGISFFAINDKGRFTPVAACEIERPTPLQFDFVTVKPSYVDERLSAVVDVLEAVGNVIGVSSEVAACGLSEEGDSSTASMAFEVFQSKLAGLRSICEGANDEHANA